MADSDLNGLYLIRTTLSHYYLKGSGAFAVPKLYREKDAKRVLKLENSKPHHPSDGPCEMIPVTIIFGHTE